MKKLVAIACLMMVLVMGSLPVFADPKAEPGIDSSIIVFDKM